MDDDENGGLFNIEVSSSDESVEGTQKLPRDFQSEEDFRKVKETWKPKIEVEEVGLRRVTFHPRNLTNWKAKALEDVEFTN